MTDTPTVSVVGLAVLAGATGELVAARGEDRQSGDQSRLEPWTLWRRATPRQRFVGGLAVFSVMTITWVVTSALDPWSLLTTALAGLLTARAYNAVIH